jgi:large subunit ribosomal protein L23
MKSAYEVVQRPLLTEKGTRLKEEANQYLFRVARTATKVEIKQAIEQLFKVKVEEVQTLRVQGKVKRLGRFQGRRPAWKKAVVRLKAGQFIELYEGV